MDRETAQENSNKLGTLIKNQIAWKFRKCSYVMDDIYTFLSQNHVNKFFFSGSKAEGFYLEGANDIDYMVCVDHIIATEEYVTQDDAILYVKLVPSKHPGYYHLEANSQNVTDVKDNVKDIFVKTEAGRPYISGFEFKKHTSGVSMSTDSMKREESGPADKYTLNSIVDWVYCIALHEWPKEVNSFLTRTKTCVWPTKSMIHEIKSMKCYLVVKGHTSNEDKEEDITEFRLSFSVIEKYLVRQLTDKQFMVHYIIKFLQKHENFPKTFESYFVKTTLFWMYENQPDSFWSQPLLSIVDQCLQELQNCVRQRVLKNYFIPENNMMTKYTQDECNLAADSLIDIRKNLFENIEINLPSAGWIDEEEHTQHLGYNDDNKEHRVIPIMSTLLFFKLSEPNIFLQKLNDRSLKANITYFDILKDLHKFRDDHLSVIKADVSDMSEIISSYCTDLSNLCIGNIYFRLARKELYKKKTCDYIVQFGECETELSAFGKMREESMELSKTRGIAYVLGLLLACSFYYTAMIAAHKSGNKVLLVNSLGRLAVCLFMTNNHGAAEYYIKEYLDLNDFPSYPTTVYMGNLPEETLITDQGLYDLLVKNKRKLYYADTNSYVLMVYIMFRVTKDPNLRKYYQNVYYKLEAYLKEMCDIYKKDFLSIKSYELLKKYIN